MKKDNSIPKKPKVANDITIKNNKKINDNIKSNKKQFSAKKAQDLTYIYALYDALNGLYLSYSFIKYSFDLLPANNSLSSSKAMRNWIATAGQTKAIESIMFITVFSMLANHYKTDDKNALKRYIALTWRYSVTAFKNLKFTNKILLNSLRFLASVNNSADYKMLLVPTGLLLGGLSAYNQYWRDMVVLQRQNLVKESNQLLSEINNTKNPLSRKLVQKKMAALELHFKEIQDLSLMSVGYESFLNSFSLYLGILSVLPLAPATFMAISVFFTFYFIAQTITSLAINDEFQRSYRITNFEMQIAVTENTINELTTTLKACLAKDGARGDGSKIKKHLDECKKQLDELQKKLDDLSSPNYYAAFILGIKNTLAMVNILGMGLFAGATILPAFCISALPIVYMALSTACFIGYALYSARSTYQIKNQNTPTQKLPYNSFFVPPAASASPLLDLVPALGGAFASGYKKGGKNIQLLLPILNTTSTSAITALIMGCAVLHALVFSLRTYLKESKKNNKDKSETKGISSSTTPTSAPVKTIGATSFFSNSTPPEKDKHITKLPVSSR